MIDIATPEEYIEAIADDSRREDVQAVYDLIRTEAPDLVPHIRSGMIGFGEYHYRYESGREGDWFLFGLASNKRYISLYVVAACDGEYVADGFRERLPKADIGKSCVRFKRLSDLDETALRDLIRDGLANPPIGTS
jgi:hypothetical protein